MWGHISHLTLLNFSLMITAHKKSIPDYMCLLKLHVINLTKISAENELNMRRQVYFLAFLNVNLCEKKRNIYAQKSEIMHSKCHKADDQHLFSPFLCNPAQF